MLLRLKTIGTWCLAHWRDLGWPMAVLFAWMWYSASSGWTGCRAALEAASAKTVIEAEAHGNGSTKSIVHVVYQKDPGGKPGPCPDVTVDSNTLAMVDAALRERPMPEPCPVVPYWGVELSGAIPLYAPVDSSMGGSVLAGPWRVGAEYSLQTGPRAVFGHRWMFR